MKCFIQKKWHWKFTKHQCISFLIDQKQVFSMFPSCTKKKLPVSVWTNLFHLLRLLPFLAKTCWYGHQTETPQSTRFVCGYELKHSTETILVSPYIGWIYAAGTQQNVAYCVSHIYTREIYRLLILCFLLLNNSSCWQLKGGSVKAKYLNGYVFIVAFVYGFFLAFSTLDCRTAVQIYGLGLRMIPPPPKAQ